MRLQDGNSKQNIAFAISLQDEELWRSHYWTFLRLLIQCILLLCRCHKRYFLKSETAVKRFAFWAHILYNIMKICNFILTYTGKLQCVTLFLRILCCAVKTLQPKLRTSPPTVINFPSGWVNQYICKMLNQLKYLRGNEEQISWIVSILLHFPISY